MQEKIKYFFNTKIIAKNVMYFKEIDSTQKKAKELVKEGIGNGTIVITDNQTNGIGTHDRKWYSEKNKNLSFTLIIYPKCKARKLEGITVGIAKCMVDTIEKLYGYSLVIKIPNDIVYNNKKMGGILTQVVINGEKIRYLLIGIGLNVNGENFDEEIKNIATSLKKEFGKEFDGEEILCEFCFRLEKYFEEKNII